MTIRVITNGSVTSSRHYPLNDVQQAAEVMGVTTFGQIHQQLRGLFPDAQISIFSDLTKLRNHHHFNQLLLDGEGERLFLISQTAGMFHNNTENMKKQGLCVWD